MRPRMISVLRACSCSARLRASAGVRPVFSNQDARRLAPPAMGSSRPYVATYGRLLPIAGGARRLASWFENTGRTPAEARSLAEQLHARKTEIMRGLIADGRVQARPGVHRLLDELERSEE